MNKYLRRTGHISSAFESSSPTDRVFHTMVVSRVLFIPLIFLFMNSTREFFHKDLADLHAKWQSCSFVWQ